MKTRFSMLLLFLIAWIGAAVPLHAETLEDYLLLAGKNNPALRARHFEYLAALEQVPQAGSLPDPEVSFNFLLEPMARYPGEQVGDITLMQMFPWFGTLRAAEDEAAAMAKARFEAFQEAKLGLYDDIRQTWFDLYRIEEELRILDEEIEILRQLEALALTRFQTGSPGGSGAGPGMAMPETNPMPGGGASGSGMKGMQGPESAAPPEPRAMQRGPETGNPEMNSAGGMADVLRVQIEIRELENERRILADNMRPLQVRFNRLLNRPDELRILLPGNLNEIPLPAAMDTIEDAIRLYHPMVRMYEWEARAGEARKSMARLEGRPMIGLGLNYSIFQPRDVGPGEMGPMDNGADMIMPMVTLTLPIYREKYNAMLRQAQHQEAESRLKKEAAENELIAELEVLVWDYRSAASRIRLFSSQMETTRTLVELLTTAYSVAGSEFEELLRTQRTLLNYERSMVEAVTAQHKTVSSIHRLMSRDIRVDAQPAGREGAGIGRAP